jgi:hypothetical protein
VSTEAASNDHVETILTTLHPGKDEMNFAEFPIAMLTDRVSKGQRSIKFEDQVYDERKKKPIPRKRLIEGSEEYGLPNATDDMVILALIQLTKQKNDFTRCEVDFSRYELIRILGWPNEGKSYDRIKTSLLRIKGVNYFYDNAWWDSRLKAWTTRAFSIIDNVEINDSRTGNNQGGLIPSRIVWNEIVFDSLKAGFVRDIDFQLCMRLEHPTALRMYRFLGKRFYLKPDLTFDLKEFANIYLNLGRNYEGGKQISRKLLPAILELEGVGFLEPLPAGERFPKKGRDWSIRFVKKTVAAVEVIAGPVEPADPSDALRQRITAEFISRGVTTKTALQLVASHPVEQLEQKIEQFDWEMTQPKPPNKPAGYLVKSITDDYSIPKGFEPKAVRLEREAAKQARESQAAEDRRRQQAEEAASRALATQVAAYRKTATAEQLARHEADAIASASEETRSNLDNPAMKLFRKTQITMLVNEHLGRLIRSGQLIVEPA